MARWWHGHRGDGEYPVAVWLHPDRRVSPSLGDHRLVGKSPEGSRRPGGETRTPLRPSPPYEVRGLYVERPAVLTNVR